MRRPSPFSLSQMLVAAAFIITFMSGCGGRNYQSQNPPTFVSQPPVAASEGQPYSYELAAIDPAGAKISYSLTSAPAGAALTGNTVTWTPTPTQSRKANNFSVSATNSAGTSTQEWTVTPTGTVRVTLVNTVWNETGPTTAPRSLFRGFALVPQSDGSFTKLTGSVDTAGTLIIPNVPGGYYWLQGTTGTMYWTSSSDVDLGGDSVQIIGRLSTIPPVSSDVVFDIRGIDSANAGLSIYMPFGRVLMAEFSGSPILPPSFQYSTTAVSDLSGVKSVVVLQYNRVQSGAIPVLASKSAAFLTDLTLPSGGAVHIAVPLTSGTTRTVEFTIKGQDWGPLLAHISPGTATPFGTSFEILASPHLSSNALFGSAVPLLGGSTTITGGVDPFGGACSSSGFTSSGPGRFPFSPPPTLLMNDFAVSAAEYADPFPDTFARYFQICQQSAVDVPLPDGSITQRFLLSNGASWASPPSEVVPLTGPVEIPTINDRDLFTTATLRAQNYTLKWNKASVGSPIGYKVAIFEERVLQAPTTTLDTYLNVMTLYSPKTTMVLPPETLVSGRHYVFVITALADGHADMEKWPQRNGLPMGNADVISAVFTIE